MSTFLLSSLDCVGLRPPSYQADDPPPYSVADEETAEHDNSDDVADITGNDAGRGNSNRDEDKRPLHPHPTGNSSSAFDQRGRTPSSVASRRNPEDDVQRGRHRRKPEELFRERHRLDERRYFGLSSASPDVDDEEEDRSEETGPLYCNVRTVDNRMYCRKAESCSSRGYADDESEGSTACDDDGEESCLATAASTASTARQTTTKRTFLVVADGLDGREDRGRSETCDNGRNIVDERQSCAERHQSDDADDDCCRNDGDQRRRRRCHFRRESDIVNRQAVFDVLGAIARVPSSRTCPSLQTSSSVAAAAFRHRERPPNVALGGRKRRSCDVRAGPRHFGFGGRSPVDAPVSSAIGNNRCRKNDVDFDRSQSTFDFDRRPAVELHLHHQPSTPQLTIETVIGEDSLRAAAPSSSAVHDGVNRQNATPEPSPTSMATTSPNQPRPNASCVRPTSDSAIIEISTYLINQQTTSNRWTADIATNSIDSSAAEQ
jgi:hypothetical protein